MIPLLPADEVASWITPSVLAGGGAGGLIAFAIIFIRFMRETQVSFFGALSETRKSCDDAQVRMAQKFSEDAKALTEVAKRAGDESTQAVARMEKSLDGLNVRVEGLTNELRSSKRPAP